MKEYRAHHTSLTKGYVSKASNGIQEPYKGKFGEDTQSEATIQTAPGIVSSLIMWHNIHPSPGGIQGRKE